MRLLSYAARFLYSGAENEGADGKGARDEQSSRGQGPWGVYTVKDDSLTVRPRPARSGDRFTTAEFRQHGVHGNRSVRPDAPRSYVDLTLTQVRLAEFDHGR